MPPEIWEEVFLFVRAHNTRLDVFDPRDPVHIIGQVCQQWRRASHFYPWLWSSILVVVPILRDISVRTVCRLREVLERSRRLPLDFVFRCNYAFSEDLLSILMQTSSRWRSAEFSAITTDNALLLQSVRGSVPQLESLTLHLERGGFESRDKISAFEIAPKLTRVGLCYVRLKQVVLEPSVKQNIRHLRIGSYPNKSTHRPSFLRVLRDFNNLTNVDFYSRSELDGAISQEEFIVFDCAPRRGHIGIPWTALLPREDTSRTVYENIRSLRMGDEKWLSYIGLPNLVSLDVGYDVSPVLILNEHLVPRVISLLRHSQCSSLVSLHLHGAQWEEDSMSMLLGLVPDLETLAISSGGRPSINDQMTVLTRFLREKVCIPRLKKLCISLFAKETREGADWEFIGKAFLDMVGMRAEFGALEVVRMRGEYEVYGRVFPRLGVEDRAQWDDLCGRGLIDAHVVKY